MNIRYAAAGGTVAGVTLAEERDAADLRAYLSRLLRYDARAVVRLRARGAVLGVFAQPPFGVIALRAVPLAAPAGHVASGTVHAASPAGTGPGAPAASTPGLDVTVPVDALLDRLVPGRELELPSAVTGPPWTGLLPPWSGWQRLATAPAEALLPAVAAGVAGFRQRSEAIPAADRSAARLETVAETVWSRPVLAGLPLRAVHAAHALGFLRPGGEASVYRAGGWLRLDAAYGTVSLRPASAHPLPLRVV